MGIYLFEEELKKNEQLQIIGEEINELRSKLINHVEKMQMAEKNNLEKVTFCLLNSANGEMEDLAFLLFRSKNSEGIIPKESSLNSRKNSILNKKNSLFNPRRGSIRRGSIKRGSIRDESKNNSSTKVIPSRSHFSKGVSNNAISED